MNDIQEDVGSLRHSVNWTMIQTKACDTFSGLEVIKHFSCSTELSMKCILLINVKMSTIVGILTCMPGYIHHLKSLR